MNKKKEQQQKAALNQKSQAVAKRKQSNEKDELSIEKGKLLLDLSKLTFAGVFLTGIQDLSVETNYLILIGIVAIVLLILLGLEYIKTGLNKKK
ncbi:MAG: hypothetical protein IJT46_08645 [Bacteroidaceae bacterium]|nr:hypothetical protein [Bacteroidaceae bacterium]MBR1542014.1 hypothetical protein [Bacteroidaceae bacterium]